MLKAAGSKCSTGAAARAVLLLPLVISILRLHGCFGGIPSQVVLELLDGFESGASGWNTVIKDTDCPPCAAATFDLNWEAARTGAYGAQFKVTSATTQDNAWYVQYATPKLQAQPARLYRFCVWIRAEGRVTADIGLNMAEDQTWEWLAGVWVRPTSEWAQYCLEDATVDRALTAYFTVDMGDNKATYSLDDAVISSEPDTTQQATQELLEDFEVAPLAWGANIATEDCPASGCPDATINLQSRASPHTGQMGVEVTVRRSVPPDYNWYVQLGTPVMRLRASKTYSYCIWARTSGPANNFVDMNCMEDQTWELINTMSFQPTPTWAQYCLDLVQPDHDLNGFFTLDMGSNAVTYYYDDASVTSQPGTGAEDEAYVSQAQVDARIEAHRKGDFTLRFVSGGAGGRGGRGSGRPVASLARLTLTLAQHDFPFGTAFEFRDAPEDSWAWLKATTVKHFNALSVANSYKWDWYEPEKGQWQDGYAHVDAILRFADESNFVQKRLHALEWWVDDWGLPDHWSRQDGCDAYRAYLQQRISRDVAAFQGRVQQFDVVNEPLHVGSWPAKCNLFEDGTFYNAYRWAHAADPAAKLCINDWNLLVGDDWRRLADMVSGMRANNVPVHCVGVQSYLDMRNPVEPVEMKQHLDRIVALGLDVHLTEYGFYDAWDTGSEDPSWSGSEQLQADLHDKYVSFWFSYPSIRSITRWGWWDKTNWITNGGIYTEDRQPKQAAFVLLDMWGRRWNSSVDVTNVRLGAGGSYTMRGFYGTYRWSVTTTDGKTYSGTLRLPASAGAVQTATIKLQRRQ